MAAKKAKKAKPQRTGICVSVNGRPTRFKIGDHIKFFERDKLRCITRISIDSSGSATYMLTYMGEDGLESQWLGEDEFILMGSLAERSDEIGFCK